MNKDQVMKNKLKKILPDEDSKILMIQTLLGMSTVLCKYIMETSIKKGTYKELPITVQYACANISANMIAFLSDGERGKVDLSDFGNEIGEQTQENIYRKMKWIIEEVHKNLQENEKV
jgi:hypothetical protein